MDTITSALSEKDRKWLEGRGIPQEIADLAGLTTIRGNLTFPYIDIETGELLYNKIRYERDGGKSFMRDRKGVPTALYWPAPGPLKGKSRVVMTEGEIDALSCMAAGTFAVCSVPDGAQKAEVGEGDIDPRTDKTFSWLWQGTQLIPQLRNGVILAVDDDEKGRVLREELVVRIGPKNCWFVTYPEGCKDLNEVLCRFGPGEVDRVLKNALPVEPDKLVKFSELPRGADRDFVLSGWSNLDKHLRINFPELVVVTGAPGSGKSQFALNLCVNIAVGHGIRTAVLQFEDSADRNRRDLYQMAESYRNINDDRKRITQTAEEWVDDHFVTIAPATTEDDDYTLEWLKDRIEEACVRQGCRIILIDPWNEIEHAFNVRENETTYTNNALRELKKLGRRYNCVIMVVAHPSKGISGKPFEDLSMYDISGSAAWKNKCDHGIIVHRDKSAQQDETWIKIDKAKDHVTMGEPGAVTMRFDVRQRLFVRCEPKK